MYRKLVKSSLAALVLLGAGQVAKAQTVFTPGILREDFFANVSGGLDGLTGDARFPGTPDATYWWNSFGPFKSGNNQGDTFGEAITGYVIPPTTGNYKFYLRSDDPGELFISTDDKAANLGTSPIAIQSGCCNAFTDAEGTLSSTPIALTAGKKYYVQALHVEGGGDDYIQIAWRTPNDPDLNTPPSNPIPAAYIGADAPSAGASVTITGQPANATATANARATFTVAYTTKWNSTPVAAPRANANPPTFALITSPQTQDADAATDASIVWFKNGVAIPGQSKATYTTPLLTPADNGAKYTAQVSVPGATAMSSAATLTVTADTTPPTITGLVGNGALNGFTVTFDGPVDPSTATNAANYTLTGGLTVSGASIGGQDGNIVNLATSAQTPGTKYTLSVKNVKDLGGNVIAANTSMDIYSWVVSAGAATENKWENVTPNNIGGLTNDVRFPNSPSSTHLVTTWEWPPNGGNEDGDNYGNQIKGWFIPAKSGDYVFFTCSDDPSSLYLSTDDSPANKHLIAAEVSWNNPRQWVATSRRNADSPENRSDTYQSTEWPTGNKITLTAGKKYYLESLHTEGGGGDNVGATFKLATDPDPNNGDAPALTGNLIATTVDPNGFISATSPNNGETAAFPDTVGATFLNSGLTTFNSSTVKLFVDGAAVTPTVTTNGSVDSVTYTASPLFAPGSKHTATLVYPLAAGGTTSNTWSFTVANYATLTPAMQVKADTSKPGFIWNYSQVSDIGTNTQNSIARAELQLSGKLGANTADATVQGPASAAGKAGTDGNAPISFTIPTVINLSINASDPTAPQNNGNFTPDLQMPGAPTSGSTDNSAAEILTYIDLPAGVIRMGVNSDDNFATYAGQIGSVTNLLGSFDQSGGRGASDTIFGFVVQQAGTYAFRTVWENGTGGSNIEWFTVNNGKDVLLNDTANGGYKTYTSATPNPGTGGGTGGGTISISGTGTNLKITFTGAIQSADSILGPWTDVSGASPVSVTATGKAKFYRTKP